jgi:hypothetical protein
MLLEMLLFQEHAFGPDHLVRDCHALVPCVAVRRSSLSRPA